MSKLLTQLNETLEYKTTRNGLIGRHGAYWFSVNHEDDGKPILIRTAVTDTGERSAELEAFLDARKDTLKVRSVHIEKGQVVVELFNQFGPATSTPLIAGLIEDLSRAFERMGLESACGFCGIPGQYQAIRSEGVIAEACESCIDLETRRLKEKVRTMPRGSYVSGFAGALLGGLLGVLLWVIMVFLSTTNPSFYPGLAAFFMALFARAGYRLFRGKKGRPMYALVGLATALSIFLGVLLEIAFTSVPTQFLPLDMAIQAFYNSDIFNTNSAWQKLIIGFAIAAIGGYGAFTTMFKEVHDHIDGVEVIS